MLGAFAVGKTSLVRQYVDSIFSDKYLTTVGVKIDSKPVKLGRTEVNLILWDLQGENAFRETRLSYLRGASGHIIVADGTRPTTLDAALEIAAGVRDLHPGVARVLLLNKADLVREWTVPKAAAEDLAAQGWNVLRTSAKSGEGVEQAFLALTRMMLEGS